MVDGVNCIAVKRSLIWKGERGEETKQRKEIGHEDRWIDGWTRRRRESSKSWISI